MNTLFQCVYPLKLPHFISYISVGLYVLITRHTNKHCTAMKFSISTF